MDSASDGWNYDNPDSGISIGGTKYCTGNFGAEEEVVFGGKVSKIKFAKIHFYVCFC